MAMLEEFQRVLRSPGPTEADLLRQMQDALLNALEGMFPADFDFVQVGRLFEDEQLVTNPHLLTARLVECFIELVTANFVSIHSYQALQSQTQRQESTIRTHIKLQQEVKIYLEHLQTKLKKYESFVRHYTQEQEQEAPIPSKRETTLLRERLQLMRRNQHLQRRLQQREEELRKYSEMGKSREVQLVESMMQKDNMVLTKSQEHLHLQRVTTLLHHSQPPVTTEQLKVIRGRVQTEEGERSSGVPR